MNITRTYLLMKNVNLSVLISNFDIKLSKTKPFFRYSHFENRISSQKSVRRSGLSLWTCDVKCLGRQTGDTCISKDSVVVTRVLGFHSCPTENLHTGIIQIPPNLCSHTILAIN